MINPNGIKANEKPMSEDLSFVYAEDSNKDFVRVSKEVLKLLLGVATKLSELDNDENFINNMVDDLKNYYLKSETYTREEIDDKLSLVPRFSVQVVSTLPTANISATTVYLLKTGDEENNLYTEYIYVDNKWEYLGKQTIDLSGYALKTEIPTKLSSLTNDVGFITNTVSNLVNYYSKGETYSKSEIDAKGYLTEHQDLSDYAKKSEVPKNLSQLNQDSTHRVVTDSQVETWNNKSNFSGDYKDLTNQPTIPSKTSQLANDSNFAKKEDIPTELPASDVYSWAKQPQKPTYSASEVGALPNTTEIPEKTSDLINDSGFITKAVNDLANYYLKSQTYSAEEIDNKISTIPKFGIEVVTSLPTTNISNTTVYLIASGNEQDNLYTEYIYVNGKWEYLGKQTVDLSGYVKRTELSSYYTETEIDSLLQTIRNSIPTKLSQMTEDATHRTVTDTEKQTWNNKSNFSGNYNDLENKPNIPSLTGYATENYVKEYAQQKGDYATNEKVSQLENTIADQQEDLKNKQPKGNYALKDEIPSVPVQSVNGKTGSVVLGASDVGGYTKEEVDAIITSLKAQGIQQTPSVAQGATYDECITWLNENGDKSKVYIMPKGISDKIFGYILTKKEVSVGGYTNALDNTTLHLNKRWSHSGKKYSDANAHVATEYIPVKFGDVVRINKIASKDDVLFIQDYHRVHYFDSSGNYVSGHVDGATGTIFALTEEDNATSWVVGYENSTNGNNSTNKKIAGADDIASMLIVYRVYKLSSNAITENDIKDLVVTINEPIKEGSTTIVEEYAWASTGHPFIPADYEGRIIDLENTSIEHTSQIKALEKAVESGGTDASKEDAYTRLKEWKYPIYEDAPVFLLDADKLALTSGEQTTEGVYAKYDTLMTANSHYITREDCGMASDGTTPIYVYHFKESEPHYASKIWSETKPVILICSGVHPTEQTGVHSLYHAMEEITTNPKLLDLRRNIHFIIMPMINPTGFTDSTYGVRNPDGIQVHYNFEVDFKYPTDAGYVENGNRNHGGETPLSIPETQYFDALMNEYKDTLACVISCHNNDVDVNRGTGYIWCSCATHFMCNLGFRFVDKMSVAWREKYGDAFDEGVRWANEYALAQAEAGSSLFNADYVYEQPEWDYRVGMASLSSSGGTEYKQAIKYGIHGINVETCDRCMILDKDFSKKRTANVITMGTETYINFFRTFMAVYDPKDKKDYAPNLPWEE